MQTRFELPDQIVRELEILAVEEGTTADRLIQQLVTERLQQHSRKSENKQKTQFPVIPIAETGPIRMFSGSDLDDIFGRDELAS